MAPTAIAYDRGEYFSVPSTFAYSDYAYGASQFNRTTATVCQVIDLGGGVTARVVTVNGQVCGTSSVDITGSGQFENSASVSVVVEYGDVDTAEGGSGGGGGFSGHDAADTALGILQKLPDLPLGFDLPVKQGFPQLHIQRIHEILHAEHRPVEQPFAPGGADRYE